MRLLIVDDDLSVVEYIVDILDLMDIEHEAVTNVEDAKKQLASTSYRFSDLVTVRDARNAVPVVAPEVETPASRRELILTLLRQSGKMRSTNIASELGCSLKTVKRELDTLRLPGHIEFVGPSKTGTYRLVGA
jgi:DNA-binding NtrC family response regulator